jgi:hypothetical protein
MLDEVRLFVIQAGDYYVPVRRRQGADDTPSPVSSLIEQFDHEEQ